MHFFLLNVCIGFRVSSTFGKSDGCMSDTPETMGGLSGVPKAPLHRQYKTARTETRRHLLLKIRQMPTQTSASRGYVLLRGVIRDTHKSPTNCLPGCGHAPAEYSKLGKTRIIKDANIRLVRNPHFLNRISICIPT